MISRQSPKRYGFCAGVGLVGTGGAPVGDDPFGVGIGGATFGDDPFATDEFGCPLKPGKGLLVVGTGSTALLVAVGGDTDGIALDGLGIGIWLVAGPGIGPFVVAGAGVGIGAGPSATLKTNGGGADFDDEA